MANMTNREFKKKRVILELLREQGYPTYAKLLDLFSLHLTKDPNVIAYMDAVKHLIVINDDLDIDSVSTVVRHEILHEYFTHFARNQVWQDQHKDRQLDHNVVNIAADYDISNKGYTDSDKETVRTLTLNNRLMRGLVTEDDRPDLVDKSFEEMLDILSEDERNLQKEMQQEIQQNQADDKDSQSGGSGNSQQSKSDNQQNNGSGGSSDSDGSDNDSSNIGGSSKKDSSDDDKEDDGHKPGQIGYRGDKETRDKEEAERQAQLNKEKEAGSSLDSDEDNEDDEEKVAKIKKAFDELSSNDLNDSKLMREINLNKQKENQAKRAKDLARYNNSPIKRFEASFSNFIKNAMGLARGKSWSKVNKTYADSGLLRQGLSRRKPNKVPSVNVYFDRSGSWDSNKTKQGYQIISTFNNYVKQGRLKINLLYFSNNVHEVEADAIREGGTEGQPILDHISSTRPDNVVIMTDDDIYDCETNVTVPGAVWLLFVPYSGHGEARSQNLIDHIHGQALTEIYDIELGDN